MAAAMDTRRPSLAAKVRAPFRNSVWRCCCISVRQFSALLPRSLEPACHVGSVIAIADLVIELVQQVFVLFDPVRISFEKADELVWVHERTPVSRIQSGWPPDLPRGYTALKSQLGASVGVSSNCVNSSSNSRMLIEKPDISSAVMYSPTRARWTVYRVR